MAELIRAGGTLYYEVHECPMPWVADPETILFHHGVGINADIWSGWVPALLERYRVVRFDLRGFGRSPAPGPGFEWNIDLLVEDAMAVADAAGTERFHFVGESMGGTVGLAAAIAHGERLLSLTAASTAHKGGSIGRVREWRDFIAKEGMTAWSEQMMERRFHEGALPEPVWRWFHEVQAASSPDTTLDIADLLIETDLTDSLAEIAIPTLLIAPDGSPFVSLDITREIHRRIPGCELQVFPGARHGVVCSHAEACSRALADFLARRSAA